MIDKIFMWFTGFMQTPELSYKAWQWGAHERHKGRWNILFIACAMFILMAVIAGPVEAHTEGKMQLSAAPAGPYKITVWTSPDPATPDELHVALAVVLAEDASPVLDAEVSVELIPADGGPGLVETATTKGSENKFLYEAIFQPPNPGLYQVDIQVSGADGVTGNTSFDLEIVDDSGPNLLYLIPAGLGLAAVILLLLALRSR